MKILIVGDSFAADWTTQYPGSKGWPNLLAEHYDVTNVAQAGCSEYRILKQVKSTYDVNRFDAVVVAHTAPYRLYTRKNPIMHKDAIHGNCDLIYSDVEYHAHLLKNWFNRSLQTAYGFFKYHYDPTHAEDIYSLIRKEIFQILSDSRTITVATPIVSKDFVIENCVVEISKEQLQIGSVNHLSGESNRTVFQMIRDALQTHA